MAQFKVEVVPVTIHGHDNADRIEIANIVDTNYQSIVKKGEYKDGDLVAYIPEGSVVPQEILAEMGLKGKLAGSQGNRVKAVRLRGVVSQGLCYPAREEWEVGQDVADELGIKKYVPPIPTSMGGEVYSLGSTKTMDYDLENIKNFPDVLEDGEEVVMTEKLHGTNFCAGILPVEDADSEHGPFIVHSKGLGSKGLPFKINEENRGNLYLRAARNYDLRSCLEQAGEEYGLPIYVLAEVYGVQDLMYGANPETGDIGLAVFDVHVGYRSHGRYLDYDEMVNFCRTYGMPVVPELYRGPFNTEVVSEHTDGLEQVSGNETHIREGVVVKPVKERADRRLGRVALKSVSEDYLFRGDGTEYN